MRALARGAMGILPLCISRRWRSLYLMTAYPPALLQVGEPRAAATPRREARRAAGTSTCEPQRSQPRSGKVTASLALGSLRGRAMRRGCTYRPALDGELWSVRKAGWATR